MFHSAISRSGPDSVMKPIEIVRKQAITFINFRKPSINDMASLYISFVQFRVQSLNCFGITELKRREKT